MTVFMHFRNEVVPAVSVRDLGITFSPTDRAFQSYICNVFGAYMAGIGWQTS